MSDLPKAGVRTRLTCSVKVSFFDGLENLFGDLFTFDRDKLVTELIALSGE